MNACRIGVTTAKVRHQTVMSANADHEAVVRPTSAIRMTGGRRQDERIGPALEQPTYPPDGRPPDICAAATIAAARPAMP